MSQTFQIFYLDQLRGSKEDVCQDSVLDEYIKIVVKIISRNTDEFS